MRKILFILGIIAMVGMGACKPNRTTKVGQPEKAKKAEGTVLTRSFPTSEWERFDFVEKSITVTNPVSYDLDIKASFDDTYDFKYFEIVFTVFDDEDNPLRTRIHKFNLKDSDGQWKSELVDGCYHFRFPLNNELTLNDPGTYKFQVENHMPITPLAGIKEISIISK